MWKIRLECLLKPVFICGSSALRYNLPMVTLSIPAPHRRWLACALVLCLSGAGTLLHADERDHADHDIARQALEQGKVLPLRTVLEKVERDYQGQAVKVEFEQEGGRYIYEIRLLQNDGRMAKLKVDAVDGKVLDVRRKEHAKDQDAHPHR